MKQTRSLLGFLADKEWAPLSAVISALFTIAIFLVVMYNYKTTYAGLQSVGLEPYIAFVLTMAVQFYQFVAPVINKLKLMKNPVWNTGLFGGWIVFLVIDFVTAYIFLLPANPTSFQYLLVFCVAFVFLIAEILLWLGIMSTANLAAIGWDIKLPSWLTMSQPGPSGMVTEQGLTITKLDHPLHRPK